MKSRINVEAITSKIDLDQLGQEIITRSEKGEFRSQSPITVLLDRLRPALMKARESKASFSALARYLNEKQITVSEASLRKYLNQYSDRRVGARTASAQRQKAGAAADKSPPCAEKRFSPGEQASSAQLKLVEPAGAPAQSKPAAKVESQRTQTNAQRSTKLPGLPE